MKKILIPSLLGCALSGQAFAETDAELLRAEIEAMKGHMSRLEEKMNRLQQENQSLKVNQQKPVEAPMPTAESAIAPEVKKVAETLEFSGMVEIGAYAGKDYEGGNYSDLNVDTAAVAVKAQLSDYSSAEISLLYEEDATDLEVDTASISFEKAGNPLSLQLGQVYLPLGVFTTSLVNDTLVQTIAETRETAAVAGVASENGFIAQTYLFNGDIDHDSASNDTLQNWGARLAWETEAAGVGLDYINNIADSDGIGDYLDDNWDPAVAVGGVDYDQWLRGEVGAFVLHGHAQLGPVSLVAEAVRAEDFSDQERLTALTALAPVGKTPSAWQLEIDYAVSLFGREYTLATAWQESDDALFLELPERRQSIGASTLLDEKTSLNLEIWRDHDYSEADGGTDDHTNNIALQLTREF